MQQIQSTSATESSGAAGDLATINRRLQVEILERKRTAEALSWELDVNRAIADLTGMLLSKGSCIEDISQLVLEKGKLITGSLFGFVGHIDPATQYLVCSTMTRDVWERCLVEDKNIISKSFHGLWGWVLSHGEPLLTNSPPSDPRSNGIPAGHLPISRFIAAPALIEDRLVGIVALANSNRDYQERDLVFVRRVAWVYAVALQRKYMEDELRYQSTHDALTGLYNRLFFESEMDRYHHNPPDLFSILVIDVDGLKQTNDRFGHAAGDELLRRTSQVLTAAFRFHDITARIGGDEFAVLLPGAPSAVAADAVRRLRDGLAAHNRDHGGTPLSFSIGTATGDRTRPVASTLQEADDCMYLEKQVRSAGNRTA